MQSQQVQMQSQQAQMQSQQAQMQSQQAQMQSSHVSVSMECLAKFTCEECLAKLYFRRLILRHISDNPKLNSLALGHLQLLGTAELWNKSFPHLSPPIWIHTACLSCGIKV
jgi:membrane protease subunit (stomatin/prohibitin family)